MKVGLIVAVGDGNIIGVDGELPWHCPPDLLLFKKLTMGDAVIMGSNSFDSLPVNGLPGREVIKVSRKNVSQKKATQHKTEATLLSAIDYAHHLRSPVAWVAGGVGLYEEAVSRDLLDFAVISYIRLPARHIRYEVKVFDPQPLIKQLGYTGKSSTEGETLVDSEVGSYRSVFYARKNLPQYLRLKVGLT